MKLSYMVLLSDDVPAAIRFWRDVVQLPLTFSDETIGYAAFETGHTGQMLSIYSRAGFATFLGEEYVVPAGRQAYLCFPVEDVDRAYAEMVERGAMSVAAPRNVPAQQSRLAHLGSSDGHLIELSGPMRENA